MSALWRGHDRPTEAGTAQDEIVFGPRVQLCDPVGSPEGLSREVEDQLGDISDLVTKMDIDPAEKTVSPPLLQNAAGDDHTRAGEETKPADPLSGLFCELSDPILQALARETSTVRGRGGRAGARRTMAATRSSLRQAARPSSIPVAERATRKLMCELDFINTQQHQPNDTAVAEYIDMYGSELPKEAIKAIQVAARLGSKNLASVLGAMAQEVDAVAMEG